MKSLVCVSAWCKCCGWGAAPIRNTEPWHRAPVLLSALSGILCLECEGRSSTDKQERVGLSAVPLCVVEAAFAQVQVPGLPCCAGMVLLLLHQDELGVEAAQLLLGQQGRCKSHRRAVQCFHGLALCPWLHWGTPGSPTEHGLDLTHLLIPHLGWFLQRPCRCLWKAFATSFVLVEFASLEGALNEGITCWKRQKKSWSIRDPGAQIPSL